MLKKPHTQEEIHTNSSLFMEFKSITHVISLFSICLLALFLSQESYAQSKPETVLKERPKLSIGSTALDFTLKSNKKENIRLNEQRGKIVLLNFWAAWSGSSTRLLSQFENLFQKYKDNDFTVLSINIDPSTAGSVLKKQNLEHIVLFDEDRRIAEMYNINTVPSMHLIDQSGKIVLSLEGFDPRYYNIIQNKLERLLVTD
jgi:peroxiredoxin